MRDPAFFAYVGALLDRGFPLYATVWDDKLPSIYLLNALVERITPSYAGMWLVDAGVNLIAVAGFAALLRREGLPAVFPTAAFAVALCLAPPLFGYTEFFAAALTVIGYLAWRRDRPVAAGLGTAAAATFWLPALLAIVPILIDAVARRRRVRCVAVWATALVAYLAFFVLTYRGEAIGVMASWGAYAGAHDAFGRGGSTSAIAARLSAGMLESGAALLLVALVGVVRAPATRTQRFGLAWTLTAFAGGFTSLNFFAHYFLPSLAPLLFTIAAYATHPSGVRRVRIAGQTLLAVAALLTLRLSVLVNRDTAADVRARAGEETRLGRLIAASIPAPVALLVDNAYEPQVYRSARALPVSRFDVVAPANRAMFAALPSIARLGASARRARTSIVVHRRDDGAPFVAGIVEASRFTRVCSREAPAWDVFVRTPPQNTGFAPCPSQQLLNVKDQKSPQS